MRGSIIKRSEGSYTIVLNLGRDPASGKRKQQWVSIKGNKKDAEKRLSELLHQLDTGTFMAPGRLTVAEYLEQWLRDYAQSHLSPRGLDRYSGIIHQHFIQEFGNVLLTGLRSEHLQRHYSERLKAGLAPATIRYHHAVIHKALQTAMKWGSVSRNVADGVDAPKKRHHEMLTWDETEIQRFLEAAKDSRYYSLFHLALYTGMRRSELLALRWGDIELLGCQINISRGLHQLRDGTYIVTEPKSLTSRRAIALSPSAALQLKLYREKRKLELAMCDIALTDDSLVFSNFDGTKPLRPNTVTYAWGRLARRAGVKAIRLHDARHSHASLMLKGGVHPKVVQERLGHSSIGITLDVYSHLSPGMQEAAARRFDELLSPIPVSKATETIG